MRTTLVENVDEMSGWGYMWGDRQALRRLWILLSGGDIYGGWQLGAPLLRTRCSR